MTLGAELEPEELHPFAWNMDDDDQVSDMTKREVMGGYGLITFGMAALLFGIKHLLLRDASYSRISKAAEYVPVVEVRVLLPSLCPIFCRRFLADVENYWR